MYAIVEKIVMAALKAAGFLKDMCKTQGFL